MEEENTNENNSLNDFNKKIHDKLLEFTKSENSMQ